MQWHLAIAERLVRLAVRGAFTFDHGRHRRPGSRMEGLAFSGRLNWSNSWCTLLVQVVVVDFLQSPMVGQAAAQLGDHGGRLRSLVRLGFCLDPDSGMAIVSL
jgi:hypothetical protein